MTKLKLFTVILFLSVLSNSAFAMDIIDHEITMGKIEAAEFASAVDFVTTQSRALIQKAQKIQEEIGSNNQESSGRVSAIGQLITVLDLNLNEINSSEDIQRIIEINHELEELLK
jgi:hypothetical protein